VREEDSPIVGSVCGNAANKPKFTGSSKASGAIFATNTTGNQYIEFNSLWIQTTSSPIRLNNSYNFARYNYIYDSQYGIRVGASTTADYNTIEYNNFDLNDDKVNANSDTVNVIDLYRYAEYTTVRYNTITGYDHFAIYLSSSSNNTIYNNYAYETSTVEGGCIGIGVNKDNDPSSDNNTVYLNYCNDAGVGLEIIGGDDNVTYANIYRCGGTTYPQANNGCALILPAGTTGSSRNKVYNSIMYDHAKSQGRGFEIYSEAGDTGAVADNEFKNNIIDTVEEYAIWVGDDGSCIGTNYFYNNSAYDYGANEYAKIEDTLYVDSDAFNARGDATGNIDTDSKMTDPANGDFTLQSESLCVDGGKSDLGSAYRYGWNPTTDMPPLVVTTLDQDTYGAEWEIGAYVHEFAVITVSGSITQEVCADITDPYTATQVVEITGITTTTNATCRYDTKANFDCDSDAITTAAFDALATIFDDTTGQTVHTDGSTSLGCGVSGLYSVICEADTTEELSNCLEIILSVGNAEGETPQPGMNIDVGGTVSIETGGTVSIE